MSYLEFAVTSNFSFLRGASHPEELMAEATQLGLAGLGLADRNSVAGVVRAHVAKRETGMTLRYHPGARLVFADGTPDILAYPRDRPGWGRLCRLLTLGNRRAEKGDCILYLNDLLEHAEGLEFLVMGASTRDDDRRADLDRVPLHKHSSSPSPRRGEGRRPQERRGGEGVRAYRDAVTPHPRAALAVAALPRAPSPPEVGLSDFGDSHVEPDKRVRLGRRSWPSTDNSMQAASSEALSLLARLREAAPGRVRLAVAMLYRGDDRARLHARADLARRARVPLIAVNDVLYHAPERRMLQDTLTCIRTHATIEAAGRRLAVNAERHLKLPDEMARLFRDLPEAIAETQKLSDALAFSLDELRYEYPDETREGFATPQDALVHLAHAGASARYPAGIPDKVRASLAHELALIASLKYAPYFLTVHDIVRFARSREILCQGRGSAANSVVCYCLGITEVDPERVDLLFERFVSADRREPPDIDVDFEHERREEVIQYIYERYGRERAGIAGTVISYRARSAIREVGKAFGLTEDAIAAIASTIWGGGGAVSAGDIARAGLAADSPLVKKMLDLLAVIVSFPRHLSQHVGGFVITRGRLDEVVPVGNAAMEDRTFVEWDKDDLDALGILKIDVLGLGMLTCLRKALTLTELHYGEKLTLASIPAEDPAVYRMLGRADSLGVFQVESRAQMSMLPRLKPQVFYDLVIEVAIVRPGPIQGDMVHPYLRRRQGLERPDYVSEELRAVLHKTLGVPLFQEQAMRIAIVAAGFTPSEADRLRRAMATFRRVGTIGTFKQKMIDGMTIKGYPKEFAERCFRQIEGFGEYGFPESHAASFALLVYASSWLKCHYPDVFAAALLNAQPMGFYAPAQIVRDAREHGVEIRPVDVNGSAMEATLEPGPRAAGRLHEVHADMADDIRTDRAIRLGLREINGLAEDDAKLIVERRGAGYDSLRDLWLRTGLAPRVLERLADADAFGSLGLTRRDALWAAKALGRAGDQDDLPLFRAGLAAGRAREPDVDLPPMPLGEEVINDYRFLKLSLRAHPVAFLRADLDRHRIRRNEELRQLKSGTRVTVAGLIILRQRPGTAKGVIFMTIEDETAIANIIVWPKAFERFRAVVLGARLVAVSGPLQAESGVIHVVAEKVEDMTPLLGRLAEEGPKLDSTGRADEVKRPGRDQREQRMHAGRTAPLARLIDEMPQLAADLDVPAHATRHAIPKARRTGR
jgi:error-prone DNA polymerase